MWQQKWKNKSCISCENHRRFITNIYFNGTAIAPTKKDVT